MVSNSDEPTSSYKYFDGSSRCPLLVNPARTSAANSDTCRDDRAGVDIKDAFLLDWCSGPSLPRNGMLHIRTDSAAETSCGMMAAACKRRFGVSRPSSHNACHRKNSPNIQDRKAWP